MQQLPLWPSRASTPGGQPVHGTPHHFVCRWIESTPSPFAPASNVSATTLRLVGMRLTTRSARDGGIDLVGAAVLGWLVGLGAGEAVVVPVPVVDVVPVVVGYVAVGVPSTEEVGTVLVTVTGVVAFGEDPHAAVSRSTATVKSSETLLCRSGAPTETW